MRCSMESLKGKIFFLCFILNAISTSSNAIGKCGMTW
jgi:hypothetical protein